MSLNKTVAPEQALDALISLELEARDYGFEWENVTQLLEQSISECEEIRDAIDNQESSLRVQEEIGDLIHTAISLCRFAGFDVKETLALSTNKFRARFESLKRIALEQGYVDMHGLTMEAMLKIWKEVKRREA